MTRLREERGDTETRNPERTLAEEVRVHALEMLACAPGAPGDHVHRGALSLAAGTLGLTVREVENRLDAWTSEAILAATAPSYDKALAFWLKGETEDALSLASRVAGEAEERLRSVLPLAAAFSGTSEPGEEAGPVLESIHDAAREKRRASLLAGHIEYAAGRLPEALDASRHALAVSIYDGSPFAWVEAASQVAWILDEMGRHVEAEPLLRSILRVMERTLGPDSPEVAASLNNLARLLRDTGRLENAEALYRRALGVAEKACGATHPQVAICLNNLAGLLRGMGRLAEAEPLLRRALEIDTATHGGNHPAVALGFNNLGSLLHGLERSGEAEECFRRALEIDESLEAPDSPAVAADLENLAIVLHSLHRHSEAEPLLRRSIRLAQVLHGKGDHRVAFGLTHLSLLLCDMDRHQEAGALAREAVKLSLDLARTAGHPAPGTRFVGDAYRRMLARLGIPDEEMPSIILMISNELERTSACPGTSPPVWLHGVLDEMGLASADR